jgi:hypothetical protein
MNDEFQYIWKEVFMPYFKVLSKYFPEGTEESHKNICHDGWSLD